VSARDPYRFLLRLPQELKEPLRDAAARSGRSLNAEIVARLEASVGAGDTPRKPLRRRSVAAVAVAAALAVAASGAFLQQRSAAASQHAHSAPRPVAKQTFANGPHYALAKRTLAREPVYAPAR
jgi:hypothetical protein